MQHIDINVTFSSSRARHIHLLFNPAAPTYSCLRCCYCTRHTTAVYSRSPPLAPPIPGIYRCHSSFPLVSVSILQIGGRSTSPPNSHFLGITVRPCSFTARFFHVRSTPAIEHLCSDTSSDCCHIFAATFYCVPYSTLSYLA